MFMQKYIYHVVGRQTVEEKGIWLDRIVDKYYHHVEKLIQVFTTSNKQTIVIF